MGLLDGSTHIDYYQGNDHGNYQFTSLDDVITQFQIAYVGEDKIIPKIKRTDIAFYAQRALQELSFDTLKSVKAQEIVLPPSLAMILPMDYVNYTKLSWVDSSGIKHPLYKTSLTSNPQAIEQNADGDYNFNINQVGGFLVNHNFEGINNLQVGSDEGNWKKSSPWNPYSDDISIVSDKLQFTHGSKLLGGITSSRIYSAHQKINLAGATGIIEVSAAAIVAAAVSGMKGTGAVRIGITTLKPSNQNNNEEFNANVNTPHATTTDFYGNVIDGCRLNDDNIFNLTKPDGSRSFVDFSSTTEVTKYFEVLASDIPEVDGEKTAYIIIISTVNDFTTPIDPGHATPVGTINDLSINAIDNVLVTTDLVSSSLLLKPESTTWSNYKSGTPAENQDDYQDDTYWPMDGSRYGLDPQHAQANGSFYIDDRSGKIHFSSNISGKTVILDYISDSLGTDGEMQVHKFAEEAMYKCIAYAILSTRANTQEYIVQRFKKERFAAVRTAKLRLSSFKLEELTQILRGKSKQIKH